MNLLLMAVLTGYNVYFADLHSHTELSDGQGYPAQAYTYARDTAGIDILGLTDHTRYMTAAAYTQARLTARDFCQPGRFVALAGQEFGSLGSGGFGHLSIYDADSLCPVSEYDLTRFYRWLAEHAEPAQFNHPSLEDFNTFAYDRGADAYVTTIEVVNGSGSYTIVNEGMFLDALRKGWHCAPVANQDNHRKHWGDAETYLHQVPLTGILADTLTKEAVLDAILHRRVYALEARPPTDRIRLLRFSVGPAEMGAQQILGVSETELYLEVQAESSFRQLYLYRNGDLFDSASVSPEGLDTNHVVWSRTVPVDNDYYLVRGEQYPAVIDTSIAVDRFWTAPVWVSYRPLARGLEFHPNPLRSAALIEVERDSAAVDRAELDVFDAAGRPVYSHVLDESEILADRVSSSWSGQDHQGRTLPNGIYLVRLAVRYSGRVGPDVLVGKLAIRR
jgi:hypothetical protein